MSILPSTPSRRQHPCSFSRSPGRSWCCSAALFLGHAIAPATTTTQHQRLTRPRISQRRTTPTNAFLSPRAICIHRWREDEKLEDEEEERRSRHPRADDEMDVDVEGENADLSSDESDEDEDESEEVKMLQSDANCSASYALGICPPLHRYRVRVLVLAAYPVPAR